MSTQRRNVLSSDGRWGFVSHSFVVPRLCGNPMNMVSGSFANYFWRLPRGDVNRTPPRYRFRFEFRPLYRHGPSSLRNSKKSATSGSRTTYSGRLPRGDVNAAVIRQPKTTTSALSRYRKSLSVSHGD